MKKTASWRIVGAGLCRQDGSHDRNASSSNRTTNRLNAISRDADDITQNGIYRLAACVGIAVGVVFITGAAFAFGLLIGSLWGMGLGHDGYEGASSDTESSWYDDGYEEDWGSDEFPDDEAYGPDAQDGQPTQPAPGAVYPCSLAIR